MNSNNRGCIEYGNSGKQYYGTSEAIPILGLVLNYANQYAIHQNNIQKFSDKYLTLDVTLEDIWKSYYRHCNETQSQNTTPKSKFANWNEQEMSEKFAICIPIQEVYGDLVTKLNLNDSESVLSKVVRYIIKKNIGINKLNASYPDITFVSFQNFKKRHMRNLPIGRFTIPDDKSIKKNWKILCNDCGITNSEELLKAMQKEKNFGNVMEKKQLNVIGCFLGQELQKVRHAADVNNHAVYILNQFVTGRFKPEEDQTILDEVNTNGDNYSVFKSLCFKLKRNPNSNGVGHVLRRYKLLLLGKATKRSEFTFDENRIILEKFFKGKELGIEAINSIKISDCKNITEIIRNAELIRRHYEQTIRPILLAYHYGKMNINWKYEFLCHVIENKYVSIKDIDWTKALAMLPFLTSTALSNFLSYFMHNHKKNQETTPYELAKEYLYKYYEKSYTEQEKKRRSKIVDLYLNCK